MIAAGMESDFSDSDCDMVYAGNKNKKSSERNDTQSQVKKTDSEFVAVPKSEVDMKKFMSQNMNSRNHVLPNKSFHQSPKPMPSRNHQQQQNRNKRSVVHHSQPLDDLRYAVMLGNAQAVTSILQKGLYVDCILKAGWTPLMYACSAAHPDIVLYLLEMKADPNYHKDQFTPLMAVCASSKEDEDNLLACCCHLLKFGANVNTCERHLTTPLMFAAREGHFGLIKELLEAGAKCDERDNRGRSALSWAAHGGHGMIVRHLINHGSNSQQVDSFGQMAADVARENGHEEIAALLDRCSQKASDSTEAVVETEEPTSETLPKSKQELIKNASMSIVEKPQEKYFTKTSELNLFLTGLGLAYLISVFQDQHLGLNDLLTMNEEDLEKMGIKQLGVRKKLLDATKATHKKEWEKSSLPNLMDSQYISCPEAVALMANIAKHLKYISSSVTYVRSQVQSQPKILELAQETANIHDLLDEMEDSLKNVRHLDDELRFLKVYLNKIQGHSRFLPGDLIIETSPTPSRALQGTVIFGFVAISCTYVLWKRPTTFASITTLIQSWAQYLFNSSSS